MKEDKRLSSAFDAICYGISMLDSDLNILLVNKTVEKWHSHALPVIGRKCYEAYHGKRKCCELASSGCVTFFAFPGLHFFAGFIDFLE